MDYAGFEELIANLASGEKNTALEVRTLFTHLIQSIYLPGDIKPVNCTQEDLENDYDETGLGTGKRIGWAQCNGLNGTNPYNGRTLIGYGPGYTEIGQLLGSKLHTLTIAQMPKHKHPISKQSSGQGGAGKVTVGSDGSEGSNPETDEVGGDEAFSLMQPSAVVLFLQKL